MQMAFYSAMQSVIPMGSLPVRTQMVCSFVEEAERFALGRDLCLTIIPLLIRRANFGLVETSKAEG